jgi:hypothetical protein
VKNLNSTSATVVDNAHSALPLKHKKTANDAAKSLYFCDESADET